MTEEIFDVVDENDIVTGFATRSKVHSQGLLHRAVHVLVFDSAGRIFLQKRSMSKDQCPGLWSTSCAGHVDKGEAYDHAAMREFREELGVEAPPLARLFHLTPGPDTGNEHVWVYRCAFDGPFVLDPQEIDDGIWMTPSALTDSMNREPAAYTPALNRIWLDLVQRESAVIRS